MKISPKLRTQFLFQNSLFVVLLISLALILGFLGNKVDLQWDLTNNQRNSISLSSKEILSQVEGPVNIIAFASKSDVEGSLRPVINQFLAPYVRNKKDITITFIDPREEPKKVEEFGIRFEGELVVQYKNRRENLNNLAEEDLTNLFIRLSRSTEKIVTALEGHGERSLRGKTPRDIGILGAQLQKTGFLLGSINLVEELAVSENASVLVIASPKVDILPGEVNRIKRFLERGGNLLWLLEGDSISGMEAIASYIGLKVPTGVVFDPRAGTLNLSPAFSLATKYEEHPAMRGVTMTSVFPFATEIRALSESEFSFKPLVYVADQGWLETGSLQTATYDEGKDAQGPIAVAGAFERVIEDKKQRIVVVGTGNVLSNQHLGLLGNLDFGVNTINWLAGDDKLITIQPRPRVDRSLEINLTVFLLANSFLALPLIFLITSGIVWWRRRRA